MSILKQVTKGKIQEPFLGVVYGVDGVGKSTLAAQMPAPVFMGAEKGTSNLDVHRLPQPKSFADLLVQLKALTDEPHEYKTLAIDSLDWVEPLVWEHVIGKAQNAKVTSIEDFGYGKGYAYALDEWRRMLMVLTHLREKRKMNIIAIAHAQVKDAKDPQATQDYNRYILKLNDKAAALWREYVDLVLFANFETLLAQDKKGKTRAFGDGARYLYTERRPAFDAKNRFGLPFQIALDWQELRENLERSNPEDASVVQHNIELMIQEMTSEVLKEKTRGFIKDCNGQVDQLKRLENKVKTLVNTPQA
jgi:hypothetical protein